MVPTRRLVLAAAAAFSLTACSSASFPATPSNQTSPIGPTSRSGIDVTSTTIAYYRFETGPAGATATSILDSTTNHHNGTILSGGPTYSATVPNSVVPRTDKSDKFSLHFGSGDAASFAYEFPFQTLPDATLEFWVNPNALGTEEDIFWTTTAVSSGDANRFNIGFDTSGRPFIDYREPSGTLHQLGTSSVALSASKWNYVAYEKKGNVYLIFVNNSATGNATKLTSSVTDAASNLPTSTGWTINGRAIMQPDGANQLSGLLDEVRLSNKALGKSSLLVTPDALR